MSQYKLSATLAGHSLDVRSLAPSPTGTLFSSSRDSTARSWIPSGTSSAGASEAGPMEVDGASGVAEGVTGWREGPVFEREHDGFVNACEWVGAGAGEGYLLTAGQDKLIQVWPLPSDMATGPGAKPPRPTHTLIGHTDNVCALHASNDGKRVVSGSWDKTAKVWDTSSWQLLHTLKSHTQSVWAVLALSNAQDSASANQTLTGAADNLIHLWEGDSIVRSFSGHTQAVRALAKLDKGAGQGGDLFASAGNDATIRIWNVQTGEQVHVLYGHDSFVYSLRAIPDVFGGGLVSGGEDRTVRVWRGSDGECTQVMTIPAVSVWSVSVLANGDVASASSDGLIRVFTKDEGRAASAEEITAFEDEVKGSVSAVPDIKEKDMKTEDALLSPGRKEGEVVMVRKPNGAIEAHQWSNTSRTWTNVGQVTGAVGSSRKQLHEGKEYDHVFDVNISDNAPALKLPYNTGQNPYEAAQKFCFANELPTEYIDQIVQFIEKNTGGVTLGGSQNEYVDPYTGASRYTAQPPSQPSGEGFTGDPFTGGGRQAAPTPKAPALLPHKTFLSFATANLPALRAKLGQLNDEVDPSLKLDPKELAALDLLVAYLLASSASSGKASGGISDDQNAVLVKLLRWPAAKAFPALDLVRLVYLSDPRSELLSKVVELATTGAGKEGETNGMLGLRAVANAFLSNAGRGLVKAQADVILPALATKEPSGLNKNGKVALATVALNYSVLAVQGALDAEAAVHVLDLIANLLKDDDPETIYRALVALGNLLIAPSTKASLPTAKVAEVKKVAKDAAARGKEERMKKVLQEIS